MAAPITAYARIDPCEAFAESFVGRFYWYGDRAALARDGATAAVMEALPAW